MTPDADGNFEFTPEGLAPGVFTIEAWARVPNYGVRLPEFENNLLSTKANGELAADWFLTGYDGEWIDSGHDGIPDANEDWLATIFSADGVTLSQDAVTTAGQWYSSDFNRDWTELFADQTSETVTIDTLDEAVFTTVTAIVEVKKMSLFDNLVFQ